MKDRPLFSGANDNFYLELKGVLTPVTEGSGPSFFSFEELNGGFTETTDWVEEKGGIGP